MVVVVVVDIGEHRFGIRCSQSELGNAFVAALDSLASVERSLRCSSYSLHRGKPCSAV